MYSHISVGPVTGENSTKFWKKKQTKLQSMYSGSFLYCPCGLHKTSASEKNNVICSVSASASVQGPALIRLGDLVSTIQRWGSIFSTGQHLSVLLNVGG